MRGLISVLQLTNYYKALSTATILMYTLMTGLSITCLCLHLFPMLFIRYDDMHSTCCPLTLNWEGLDIWLLTPGKPNTYGRLMHH